MILLPWALDGASQESEDPNHRASVALSFSAMDCSATVGLGADLRTFVALGVHPTSVATSISAQNTRAILGALPLPSEAVQRQFEALTDDLPPHAMKSGRVLGGSTISLLAELVHAQRDAARKDGASSPPLVVDPVLFSHEGEELQGSAARTAYQRDLLPLASIATPNAFEAEVLSGRRVGDLASMKEAAKVLFDLGIERVVVTSHPDMRHCVDVVYDGTGFVEFGADRVSNPALQGVGCVFSSAITACLARGDDPLTAVERAKEFCSHAVASGVRVGSGRVPTHPMVDMYKKSNTRIHIVEDKAKENKTS